MNTSEKQLIDPSSQAPEPSSEQPGQKWWVAPIGAVAVFVACMVGCLSIYHHYFAARTQKFAVLDLHHIVEAKEIEFTAMLGKPNVTEEDRKQAMDMVASIEPQLKQVLIQVRAACDCEILVKAAALTSDNIPDLTQQVAMLMKINEQEVAKARELIRRNLVNPAVN